LRVAISLTVSTITQSSNQRLIKARLGKSKKGGDRLEQVNIEGKRSGNGFVAHKDTL